MCARSTSALLFAPRFSLLFCFSARLTIFSFLISHVYFEAASGPVRLFTPYKRRRKAQHDSQDNNSSGNGQTTITATAANTVTITTPVVTTNSACSTINNTSIINKFENTTQQLHIQTTPIQNNNNNNTVTINANNGIKKKRFSLNIVNVKPSGAESSDDVESENITFTPAVTAHQQSVKEETVTPWQTVTEAIQEIPADYVDQTRECNQLRILSTLLNLFSSLCVCVCVK
jgi:hypothetical protein